MMFFPIIIFLSLSIFVKSEEQTGCSNRAFIGCILQLKEEHIQFDRNIVRVILGIDSEAKLLHTCRSYTTALPCFRDKILECGNDQQKETFKELGRALMFLCSPFSLNRQRVLIRQHDCIAKVLSLPISAGCKLPKKPYGDKLDACKRHCSTMPKNFTCSLQTWISEQNLCTLNDIQEQCGKEASEFYVDLQSSIFESTYPFVCQKDDRILTTTSDYLATKPPVIKTEIAELFTKTQLSTKKPYKSPMFYISPQTIAQQNSTILPPIRITPSFPTTESPSNNLSKTNKTSQHISAAQATLIVLLQKLLPLALKSNLTSLLNQRNEILELSKRIDFKHLIQNSTTKVTQKVPQQNPVESASYLTAIHVTPTTQATTRLTPPTITVKSVTPSTSVDTKTPATQQVQAKTWRPWYFAQKHED